MFASALSVFTNASAFEVDFELRVCEACERDVVEEEAPLPVCMLLDVVVPMEGVANNVRGWMSLILPVRKCGGVSGELNSCNPTRVGLLLIFGGDGGHSGDSKYSILPGGAECILHRRFRVLTKRPSITYVYVYSLFQ